MTIRLTALLALTALAACTAGGIAVTGGSGGGNATVIDVNLTLNPKVGTAYGESGGMKPPVTTVPVGSSIRFTNTDGFAHTATLLPNSPTTFPSNSPLQISATTQSGTSLSGGFSSGAMQAGTSSQIISVDKPGTYLFGCFFHYPAPMRGAIVAQ